jgi:hypothetical protein
MSGRPIVRLFAQSGVLMSHGPDLVSDMAVRDRCGRDERSCSSWCQARQALSHGLMSRAREST